MNEVLTKSINIDAGILTTVVVLGGYRTANATGEEQPNVVKLTGLVRDFHERTHAKGHPDFEQRPEHGFGLYCGNVGLYLGADGKPDFTGMGRKVSRQAYDAEGRAIAPHLANRRFSDTGEEDGGGTDLPESCAILQDSKGVDAYEVCLVSVNNNPDGTSAWTYHVREIGGKDLSHWNLKLDASHQVVSGTTPGYDFGVDGSTGYFGIKWDVEESFTEGDFTIVLDGQYEGDLDPEGVLAKGGTKASDPKVMFVPTTHVWPTTPGLVADDLGDEAASMTFADTGAIDSAKSFDQWFHDELGVNVSRPLTLNFVEQEDGSYVFDDKLDPFFIERGGFFPVDDALFGNSGGDGPDHNYHFTFELHTTFTYDADADQYFTFTGDDDVWVYIDGKLAIDLGGVHGTEEQTVDMSRMGLVDGESYTIDVFFAERHRTQCNFRIQTNLDLAPTKVSPAMTAAFD